MAVLSRSEVADRFGLGRAIELSDGLEPKARDPDRSGAEALMAELLDEPHTRSLLGALLDAVHG